MSILMSLARKFPEPIKRAPRVWYGEYKKHRALQALRRCKGGPAFLSYEELERMMKKCSYPEPCVIRYDAEGLRLRALANLERIKKYVPLDQVRDCLEMGCRDGMVLGVLAEQGKKGAGVDLDGSHFDERALKQGVRLIREDASKIPFPDGSFDLIFSFSAFEHFSDPAGCLKEAARLLRKGGFIYLFFTPAWTSPYGRHAYRAIRIPYCHHLFKEEDLLKYAKSHGLPSEWPYVNDWTVTRFRSLWKQVAEQFDTVFYEELETNGAGAELIELYPSCFKGKAPELSEFFLDSFEVVLKKR